MLDTFKWYSPVAGLALISRITLDVWPVEVVHASQTALLEWPIFLIILFLGFPAVHFSEKWGRSSIVQKQPSWAGVILRAFAGGAFLVDVIQHTIPLAIWFGFFFGTLFGEQSGY